MKRPHFSCATVLITQQILVRNGKASQQIPNHQSRSSPQVSNPLQMILDRYPGLFGIKAIDIQEVGRLLTPSRSLTLVQKRPDTLSHAGAWTNNKETERFPFMYLPPPRTRSKRVLMLEQEGFRGAPGTLGTKAVEQTLAVVSCSRWEPGP